MAQRTDSIAVMTCGLLVCCPSKSLEKASVRGFCYHMATDMIDVEPSKQVLNGNVTHGDALLERAIKELAAGRRGLILVSWSGRFW